MSNYVNRTSFGGRPAIEIAKDQIPYWRKPGTKGRGWLQVTRDGEKGFSFLLEETALGERGERNVTKQAHISLEEGEALYLIQYLIANIDPKRVAEEIDLEVLTSKP